MLHNPWRRRIGGYTGSPIDERGLTPGLKKLVRSKSGDGFATGFGYGSCAFIGRNSVIKIAPFPFHTDRFVHEKAVAGIELPGVSVPKVLDEGITDDFQWIEIERIAGRPAYERWNGLTETSKLAFIEKLAGCVAAIQQFSADEAFLYAKFDNWHDHVMVAVHRALQAAQSIVPGETLNSANKFAADNESSLSEVERVTCHGDLWFGNLLLNEQDEFCGIIDWDRLAIAPPDYEIDMLWRFWRYPQDFPTQHFAGGFTQPLDPGLLSEVARVSAVGLDSVELNSRLSLLELAYRLGVGVRLGWDDEHQQKLETVLSGRWTEGLMANS